ncbi:LysR family transcriptional regulator [Actinomadura yumaensis]|uniref:helix-turn-helix domain-containing protein n=1 Tax=Actinomadura yumaensis TaxID=111807 RepID=UPI00362013CC
MDLGPQHLRMIVAVSETGSIGKAAARLDLTQPAVSTMLRRVEKHLGVRLFVRSPPAWRSRPSAPRSPRGLARCSRASTTSTPPSPGAAPAARPVPC